ncbi:DUF3828 domain-containing protein [Brevundimonas bacteroides]|uniref:DUF3828 domain-containing protein n=1 Tax=Brevundimonas bacteroides TaxID=74311 RepID=UPI0004974B0C|nr:DUF3828 domain-containing protein [Brevundimonas bacteroides]
MRILISLTAVAACAAIAACSPAEEAAPADGAAADASASAGAVIPPTGSEPVTREQIYAAAAEGPEAFARAIYGMYATGGPQGEPPAPGQDPIYSRTLNALIGNDFRAAGGEVGTIDYDIFCQCQDQEGFAVNSMAAAQSDENTAAVSVVFTNMGEQKTAILNLVREGGNWKVDDVEMGMNESVKDILTEAAEGQG